jgi:predicted DCC family thiol-disulfide oxidoreductase YuxK
LFFDGECNLCNAWVQRVLKFEKVPKIYFSSLQSDFASRFLKQMNYNSDDKESLVLYTEANLFFRSEAAIKLCAYLKFPFSWMPVFLIIPIFIRDAVYNWVARNRYQWWGKKDRCVFFIEGKKERFLQ